MAAVRNGSDLENVLKESQKVLQSVRREKEMVVPLIEIRKSMGLALLPPHPYPQASRDIKSLLLTMINLRCLFDL